MIAVGGLHITFQMKISLTPSQTTQYRCCFPIYWKDTSWSLYLWSKPTLLIFLQFTSTHCHWIPCSSFLRPGWNRIGKNLVWSSLSIHFESFRCCQVKLFSWISVFSFTHSEAARCMETKELIISDKGKKKSITTLFFVVFVIVYLKNKNLAIDLFHFSYSFVVLKEIPLLKSKK